MSPVGRDPNEPIENLAIGKVIEVDGLHIVAELDPRLSELSRIHGGETYSVGQFGSVVKIHFGRRIVYALVFRLRMKAEYQAERGVVGQVTGDERVLEADLFGEAEWIKDSTVDPSTWRLEFERGVATYPLPQQTVYLTPRSELRVIYGSPSGETIEVGQHVGSAGSPCFADLNELLGKHTAVLGSTGAGKSAAVAAILHSILDRGADGAGTWNPLILILDPHNEYGAAFDQHSRLSTDEGTLQLPYWLLSLDETVSLLVGRTEDAATSQANIVKNALLAARIEGAKKLELDIDKINVDSPVPYLLGDPSGLDEFGEINGVRYDTGFVGAVNAQRPAGKDRSKHEGYGKILRKLDALLRDARLSFLMTAWDGESDPLPVVLAQLLGPGSPIRVIDLSGIPNEIAGAASAAVARVVFDVKVWQTLAERQASPVLLVCEEAHRYVPNKGAAQYEAAQNAIRRLAKEGRKYGIGLMLVSQRPSEVEATVLSQCNSWIVLRVTNEEDRAHVRSILPDSMAGLSSVLSGLRRQEAIFVGQAAAIPSRIIIRTLEPNQLPRSNDVDFNAGWQNEPLSADDLKRVATRWRYQQRVD